MFKKALCVFFVSLSVLLFQCKQNFENIGDPSETLGLLYSFNFSQSKIVLSETPSSITEGSEASFSIKLSEGITQNKTVTIKSDNSSAISINGSDSQVITFTPENATTEQIITLKAEGDENTTSEQVMITVSSPSFISVTFEVTSIDEDEQGILITSNTSIIERGTSINLNVRLAQQPSDNINVYLTSGEKGLLTAETQNLVFTPDNFNKQQIVTLSATTKLSHEDTIDSIVFSSSKSEVITKTFVVGKNLEYVDISAGKENGCGYNPAIAIDDKNNKLIVITENYNNSGRPSLFNCNLDGTDCYHKYLYEETSIQYYYSGTNPALTVDTKNDKLYVVTEDEGNFRRPSLFYCNLDGSNCSHKYVYENTTQQSSNTGWNPDILLDSERNKLLIITENGNIWSRPSLFYCTLDTLECTHKFISEEDDSGYNPSAVIDSKNSKLIVVSQNLFDLISTKPSLYECDLVNYDCVHTFISDKIDSDYTPDIFLNSQNNNLIIATRNDDDSKKAGMFFMNLNNKTSYFKDVSIDQGYGSGYEPFVLIDNMNLKIYLATRNYSNNGKLSLFKCNLDGSECKHFDLSAGQGIDSGYNPSMAIDYKNNKLLIVTQNGSNNSKPALFRLSLNFTE